MKLENQIDRADLESGTVFLVDKPLEWTSFDVVAKIRGILRQVLNVRKHKVGHAGTLDPLASGLLIVCTGKMTKQIHLYQDMPKEYTGTITLGGTTPSYDREMPVDQVFPVDHITPEGMEKARISLMGEILQEVPLYSAVKVEGRRLYDIARKGESVISKSRNVFVHEFEIDTQHFPDIRFRIVTSKGTYIRAIAHDFGRLLNSGAHLSELRRTKIGKYKVDDAWRLEELTEALWRSNLSEKTDENGDYC